MRRMLMVGVVALVLNACGGGDDSDADGGTVDSADVALDDGGSDAGDGDADDGEGSDDGDAASSGGSIADPVSACGLLTCSPSWPNRPCSRVCPSGHSRTSSGGDAMQG